MLQQRISLSPLGLTRGRLTLAPKMLELIEAEAMSTDLPASPSPKNNAQVIVNRIRNAARALATALDEGISAHNEFIALGGSTWTNSYFLNEQGQPRTDLDITSADLDTAQIGLDAIADYGKTSGYTVALEKVK